MSDLLFHYTLMEDKSDGPTFSCAGTESKRGYHALERTSYLPVYQASRGPSAVSLELQRSVFPPKDWPVDTSIQPRRPATAAQFDSPPFPLPPTLRGSPIPSHASDYSPPHFGYNMSPGAHRLISEHHPQIVVMPTLTGNARYGGGVIDAHTCHCDPSFGVGHDNYMVECPRALPSPAISMPIVPTYLDVGVSSCVDPLLPSDPPPRWSPHHATTAYQYLLPPDFTPSLSQSGNFDSESYSSPSPLLSTEKHNPVAVPPEMSDQIQPQLITAIAIDQRYTFTVPLQIVEFPLAPNTEEVPFFQCCWEDCGIWITSDKEAVKNHLTHTHNIVLKGKSTDLTCCEWVGCSSSLRRCGLVRHFRTHLGLKWLCSMCKGAYTRPDSVGYHAHREPRCELAQAISYPSPMAYRARINGDSTVTLTKILQP